MIFGTPPQNPKVMIRLGMAALLVTLVWPRNIPLTGTLSTDAIDGVRGLFLGIALGFLIWGARMGGFQRR
jgi:hypothetical protein